MQLSVFDIFKIGVGPSSSHTMGPMIAAERFMQFLKDGDWPRPMGTDVARVQVHLHGSLAFTGKGHATDRAVILGLCGFVPEEMDLEAAELALAEIARTHRVGHDRFGWVDFDPASDLIFDYETPVGRHANAMTLDACDAFGQRVFRETYYSVGGGFVLTEEEFDRPQTTADGAEVPHQFSSAGDLLALTEREQKSIAELMRENELARRPGGIMLDGQLDRLWAEMNASIDRGLSSEGDLPGGLKVKRRAAAIFQSLQEERRQNHFNPLTATEWLTVYAMAVNEENAAGGRIVTAPTNGAAGVLPATIKYFLEFNQQAKKEGVREFLLTAAAVGAIIKQNASISGAEVGCQGEVGSAAAMAAAGLAAVMGGTPAQVENAAEIALEHHLGMTCDPVAGLVQIPCIERNGLGAVKAVTAATLALRGDGKHMVTLDACVETMRQTGRDMDHKYKETSLGGLAVNAVEC